MFDYSSLTSFQSTYGEIPLSSDEALLFHGLFTLLDVDIDGFVSTNDCRMIWSRSSMGEDILRLFYLLCILILLFIFCFCILSEVLIASLQNHRAEEIPPDAFYLGW